MAKKRGVIWGAGKIGRGFVADFFFEAGYEIVFIDASMDLVNQMRQADFYTLVKANNSGSRKDTIIKDFSVLHISEKNKISDLVCSTDLICIAVYPDCLPVIANQLAPIILRRMEKYPGSHLNIILCTNLLGAANKFRNLLENELPSDVVRGSFQKYIGIIDSIVIRLVATPPKQFHEREPLLIWTNGVADFPVDRLGFVGDVPIVPNIRPILNMHAEQTRKLYTYNMLHAVLSYFGYWRGYRLIVECMQDPELLAMGEKALNESSLALRAEFGFGKQEMDDWLQNVITQTNDPILSDTVQRYASDPERKLRRDDRLIGPTLLSRKHGIEPVHLIDTIAAALIFDDPGDQSSVKIQNTISSIGIVSAIHKLCELNKDEEDVVEAIAQSYEKLRKDLSTRYPIAVNI